jgi:hypothetical protein
VRKLVCVASVVGLVVSMCWSGPARADIALGFVGGHPESPLLDDGTWGWSFTVSNPITVTHLGFYAGSAGLVNSHNIGIWANNGALQVSGTVASGAGAGWHWTSISNTLLTPGTYVIGAYYHPTDPDVGYSNATSVTMGSDLTFGQNRFYEGTGFHRPDSTWSGYGKGVFGPNFQYVPEPAFLQLPFLIGIGGMGLWLRRRSVG